MIKYILLEFKSYPPSKKKPLIHHIFFMIDIQAGRYLPEFREIRKKNPDFIKLCLNERLSAEISLQPIKRFDLDAVKGTFSTLSF